MLLDYWSFGAMQLERTKHKHKLARLLCYFGLFIVACGPENMDSLNTLHKTENALGRSFYRPQLGVGVDFSETKTFRRCVTLPIISAKHAMASRLYTELAIRDRDELNEALNIDASVGAKGLWGSASGSAGYFKDVKMSSDAFYWLVNARYALQDDGVDTGSKEFSLTEEAKRILAGPRGLTGFYEACGEYFYSGSQLASHYALLYEFKSSEETTMERIKASASYEGWGVQAKAEFENFAQMAQKSSVLKVHAASSGGSDSLKSYATNPEQLETELAILRKELYQDKKGVQTQWYMSDYNMFPEIQEAKDAIAKSWLKPTLPVSSQLKEQALARLYRQYNRNINYEQLLIGLLEKSQGKEPLYRYKPDKLRKIQGTLAAIEINNLAIAERAKECIFGDEKDCLVTDLTDIDLFPSTDPAEAFPPDEDHSTLQGWSFTFSQRSLASNYLDVIAKSPARKIISFDTSHSLFSSDLGIYARADEAPEFFTIIGWPDLVRDPVHAQMRPNVCVYNFAETCNLRIIGTLPKGGDANRTVMKMQLVLFDKYGLIEKRIDFPALD